MITERGCALALVALQLLAGAASATGKETFSFGYLQRADDPAYRPHRSYTGLTLRDRHRPIDGAKTAIRSSRILGRALGLRFALTEITLTETESAVRAVQSVLAADGPRILVLDLPFEDVVALGAALEDREVALFNVRHAHDSLRAERCASVLYHTLPSHAMLADGLAQHLRRSNWRRALVLEGETEDDHLLGAALRRSADKFGLELVDVRPFVLGNDPRERDRNNVRLLTSGADHDTVIIVDTVGEFGRYVPYRTQRPRPVVGTEGLVSSAWHWTWERHGAPQLNQRFDRIANRRMGPTDYAAWAAVRAVVEGIRLTRATDVASIRAALVSPDFTLDTYKGAPGNFRRWDHQLRQAILLHTHNSVVDRAPFEEFLHEKNTLDTLGFDERESGCRMRR